MYHLSYVMKVSLRETTETYRSVDCVFVVIIRPVFLSLAPAQTPFQAWMPGFCGLPYFVKACDCVLS